MRHETSRDARATGEAPAPRDRAGEGGAHAVRGGPPAVGVGEFGVPLVAGVSARWASGTAGQADARAPVEAVGRPETDIGASAGARSAPGRLPDRPLDAEAGGRPDSPTVRRSVSSRARVEAADRAGLELPEAGAACRRAGRGGHRPLKARGLAPDKKRRPPGRPSRLRR